MNQQTNKPPRVLVHTWITLLRSDKTDLEVKQRAMDMLKSCIGDKTEIEAYMKDNNL